MTTEAQTLARIYVITGSILIFVILWGVVAARPMVAATQPVAATTQVDPRLADLQRRELAFNEEAKRARAQLDARWVKYRRQRDERVRQIAAARKAARQAPAPAPSYYGGGSSYSAPTIPAVQIVRTPAPSTATSSS